LPFLTGGMRDNFTIDGCMRDESRKSHVAKVTRRTVTLTRRDRDKHSELSYNRLRDYAKNSGAMRD